MFSSNYLKKGILLSSITAAAIFGFNGCLDERALPGDGLVTIYNSDLEKTNRLHPLDTMYAQLSGLKEDSRYEIRVLDSDRNLITSTQVYTDSSGLAPSTPIWYDVGLKKPTATNPTFHIETGLDMKSFYINVVDLYDNGNDTNFEQPFYYISKVADQSSQEYPKPTIYACDETGMVENRFEETGSKDMDGVASTLTKIHVKADVLSSKNYTTGETIENVDVYILPYTGILEDNTTLDTYTIKKTVSRADLISSTGVLVWDLNDDTTLINPDSENSAYNVIVDLDQDGIYKKGIDLDNDNLTDRYIDAVDGGAVPGFIVQDTPANELSFSLVDVNKNKINSLPESVAGSNSIYLDVDNIATNSNYLTVNITGGIPSINKTVSVDVSIPSASDEVRYMKYIEKAKIFNTTEDYAYNISTEQNLTVTISELGITTNIIVYPIETTTTTHQTELADVATTFFDETGTDGGSTDIYMKFEGNDPHTTGDVYLYNHNKTWTIGEPLENELAKKDDVNITNDSVVKIFDLNSDVSITNPTENSGMFDLVVDYDNNGFYDNNDKIIPITIRDTVANDAPNVGYINIASSGYFGFDNHYSDNENVSMYGYIDEFKKDGSNTHYPIYGSTQGVKAIWNPYIKNKKRVSVWWSDMAGGDSSTYIDYDGENMQSPFNFGQTINLYIIDAVQYKLKANMTLEDKDVRGYGSVHTVQYSCSNGCAEQTVWRPEMTVGKYYMIIDVDKDGKITEGVDYIDAVDQNGKKITEDSSVVGFSVID